MLRIPSDRTLPLLSWFFVLGLLGCLSMECLPILPQKATMPLSLNAAQFEDLMTIPRLQVRVARAILQKREQLGRFSNWDEIQDIKGVGPKTIEKLKAVLKIF